jgi:hypothetical protein
MEKTKYKPLAARHGRGTAWARHGVCELFFKRSCVWLQEGHNILSEVGNKSASGKNKTAILFSSTRLEQT